MADHLNASIAFNMTDSTTLRFKLVRMPPPTSATSPATLAQVASILSRTSKQELTVDAISADPTTWVDQWLDTAVRLSAANNTMHLLAAYEFNPIELKSLILTIAKRQPALRLCLCANIEEAPALDLSAMGENAAIVQIQWRLSGRLPDLGFFKTVSRAGIWNHLLLDGAAATPEICDAVARQPNIVHSWETTPAGDRTRYESSVYRQVAPLPGRPLWQALNDPLQRFVLLDRLGKAWLLGSRLDDATGRIYRIGDALEYRFCPPDRLPDGYLDEICAMVAAGGTVAATHVRTNLERAYLIGYVLENGVIVGNSSLKNPRPEYIDTVRHQSGLDLTGFVERGYTSVRPEYRGLGIGTRLLEGLTARAGERKIFSVIAEDNEATKIIALRNNTRKVATYYSQKAGKPVGIWMPAWMIDPPADKGS